MKCLNDHTITMRCRYGLHIVIVMTLSFAILLVPRAATAQEPITPVSGSVRPVTRFSQIDEAEPANIDPKVADRYEPDNITDEAKPVAVQIDTGRVLKQVRTFHSETDRDWIYFYGLKQFQYYFYIEVFTEGDESVRMSLFDATGVDAVWRDQVIKNASHCWECPRNGHFTLQLEPVFTPASPSPTDGNAFTYRFWMKGVPPAPITLSGGVYGRVINQDGNGINRVHISLKNGGEIREDMTDSIGELWEIPLEPSKIDGWFFIDGLYADSSYELLVTTEEDPNNYLVPPFT
ncbi:MAG: hypothetical protein ACMUIL_10775, partial [bacterium]